MSNLESAIIRTLVYYDLFDYPLTVEELWRWLYPATPLQLPISQADIETALVSDSIKHRIQRSGAYVLLTGREALVTIRQQRHEFGKKKWRRALTGAQFLEIVPFVKLVAVSNTLAIDNAKVTSDIDYVIVTSPGFIWLTRLMVTGVISLLGLRRHDAKIQDRICLSFYVSREAMNFEKIAAIPDDPHRLFLTAQIVPLMNDDETYQSFRTANSWVNNRLPNAWEWAWEQRIIQPNKLYRSLKHSFESFFSTGIGQMFEGLARDRQLKKMAGNINSRAKELTHDVIINEDMLKFHENNRLAENNNRFQQRLTELGIS